MTNELKDMDINDMVPYERDDNMMTKVKWSIETNDIDNRFFLVEEIHIEKLNEQWASMPHEQLLNQSFTDQLNSIQISEQLAPLELAKQHLPVDIIDILEC